MNYPTTNKPHKLRYTGDAPLLLGNSLHDPATPWIWSANAARQLGPKAVLLTYEGWGGTASTARTSARRTSSTST
ncbi:alpha/beta hydrolase [Nonomuraea salmonea]|uniref:alpha/beta hydrolase n=1 Tax=Nonomuraea salmonea TaxID=46181 RepID=UPI003CD09D78